MNADKQRNSSSTCPICFYMADIKFSRSHMCPATVTNTYFTSVRWLLIVAQEASSFLKVTKSTYPLQGRGGKRTRSGFNCIIVTSTPSNRETIIYSMILIRSLMAFGRDLIFSTIAAITFWMKSKIYREGTGEWLCADIQ